MGNSRVASAPPASSSSPPPAAPLSAERAPPGPWRRRTPIDLFSGKKEKNVQNVSGKPRPWLGPHKSYVRGKSGQGVSNKPKRSFLDSGHKTKGRTTVSLPLLYEGRAVFLFISPFCVRERKMRIHHFFRNHPLHQGWMQHTKRFFFSSLHGRSISKCYLSRLPHFPTNEVTAPDAVEMNFFFKKNQAFSFR